MKYFEPDYPPPGDETFKYEFQAHYEKPFLESWSSYHNNAYSLDHAMKRITDQTLGGWTLLRYRIRRIKIGMTWGPWCEIAESSLSKEQDMDWWVQSVVGRFGMWGFLRRLMRSGSVSRSRLHISGGRTNARSVSDGT